MTVAPGWRRADATERPPVLLTGDNAAAAGRVAGAVGIVDVRAGLLPADKVAVIEELENAGARVLLVGDGVNDALAIAPAAARTSGGQPALDRVAQCCALVVAQ